MTIKKKIINTKGIKLFIEKDGRDVARAFLFILYNDFRNKKFGYMEDVFVVESLRGQGIGTKLVNEIINVAKKNKCYKIVATSRFKHSKVHSLYKKLGFKKFGLEFKMYLENLEKL